MDRLKDRLKMTALEPKDIKRERKLNRKERRKALKGKRKRDKIKI